MTDDPTYIYNPKATATKNPWFLVSGSGGAGERRFPFFDRVEIGRFRESRRSQDGILMIKDETVSRSHCILTRTTENRCFIRDTSRNGTWLDGRRLMPNIEVEVQLGHVVGLGKNHRFVLEGESSTALEEESSDGFGTMSIAALSMTTVLVGDIRDFTVYVQKTASEELQRNVNRVFHKLEGTVTSHGGTIKEYPGDAIFAFWDEKSETQHAIAACRAALALNRLAEEMARDRSIWTFEEFPLRMDWALVTGHVVTRSMGGDRPIGLSMVGEPVVLAFRIEKLADETTGPILACARTVGMAEDQFQFRDLGEVQAKGFEHAKKIFALTGEKAGNDT